MTVARLHAQRDREPDTENHEMPGAVKAHTYPPFRKRMGDKVRSLTASPLLPVAMIAQFDRKRKGFFRGEKALDRGGGRRYNKTGKGQTSFLQGGQPGKVIGVLFQKQPSPAGVAVALFQRDHKREVVAEQHEVNRSVNGHRHSLLSGRNRKERMLTASPLLCRP